MLSLFKKYGGSEYKKACSNLFVFQIKQFSRKKGDYVPIYRSKNEKEYFKDLSGSGNWMFYRNDKVKIISGKNKDIIGRIIKVQRLNGSITVEGVNPVGKELTPQYYMDQYQSLQSNIVRKIVEYKPERIENCVLIHPVNEQPIKCEYMIKEDGSKGRFIVDTGEELPIQYTYSLYTERAEKRPKGLKDTASDIVLKKDFKGIHYEEIARNFIKRIREIKQTESQLIFKDKKPKRFEYLPPKM